MNKMKKHEFGVIKKFCNFCKLLKRSKYSPSEWGECSGEFINCKPGKHSLNIPFDKIHMIDPYCKTPNNK